MEYISQQFKSGQVLRASQLNAMDNAIRTSMKSALPAKVEFSKKTISRHVHIIMKATDLEPSTEYALQLFRWSRSKHAWEMVWDDDSGRSNYGWQSLRGKKRSREEDDYFTSGSPCWMPNEGWLQSRWTFTTGGSETSFTMELNPSIWVLDTVKPRRSADFCSVPLHVNLIGVKGGKHASLKFKVGVLERRTGGDYHLVGLSDSTLNVFTSTDGATVDKDSETCDISTKVTR